MQRAHLLRSRNLHRASDSELATPVALHPLPPLQGVGSHAAHLLLRSGVGRLRLIDFDLVTLSSLNRHCLATRADVGIPKATCLAKHFATIVPEVRRGGGASGVL